MDSHQNQGNHLDFDMDSEEPYSCCSVQCIGCEGNAAYTERPYNSDFGLTKGTKYFNLGQFCPMSKCCDGPVCFNCVYSSNFFCRFCCKESGVHFLDKDDFFSERTSSRHVTKWFDRIWEFTLFQKKLAGTCKLFFSWLQEDFLKRHWCLEFYSWHRLCLDIQETKDIISEFNHFFDLSIMVASHTFFSRLHRIPVKFNKDFQKNLTFFLEACYGSPFSISFGRREMLKQFQIGFVGTLSLRLSESRQYNNFWILRKIFNRIMLNLLVAKK